MALTTPRKPTRPGLVVALAALLGGCTMVDDCGDVLGDKSSPRIRSSTMRMRLADPPAASARFAPFAAMAALVYEEAAHCRHGLRVPTHRDALRGLLEREGWREDASVPGQPACDDDVGTFFRVWSRTQAGAREVAIVFRGTQPGVRDWMTGNLRWLTRLLPGDDQYDRSRHYAGRVLAHLKATHHAPLRVVAVGHSLGGGLAQNALYAYPHDILQAFAFNPSPVTGYADNDALTRRAGCDCLGDALGGEARVYRIYETDEVLAWLRLPLKLALPLNRHIQEVRLNFGNGHAMSGLAQGMADDAQGRTLGVRGEWWAGRPDATGRSCTAAYAERLRASCNATHEADVCPR